MEMVKGDRFVEDCTGQTVEVVRVSSSEVVFYNVEESTFFQIDRRDLREYEKQLKETIHE